MDYKDRIVEKAAELFRTYGIRAVTMDMLAQEMGISKRTIYEIFTDKDELLKGVLMFMGSKQTEVTESVLEESDNIIEAVFRLLNLMNDHFRNTSPAFRLDMKKYHQDAMKMLDNEGKSPYGEVNAKILKRGIEEGYFRSDIDIEITNKCLYEVARMAHDKDLFPPDDYPDKDVIRNFFVNYLRGISTPEGLQLIDYYDNNLDTVKKIK